jgi:hypothetical protein
MAASSFQDVSLDALEPCPAKQAPPPTTYGCGSWRSATCCWGHVACTPRRKTACLCAAQLLVACSVVGLVCGLYFGVKSDGGVALRVSALQRAQSAPSGRHRRMLQDAGPAPAMPSSTESAYAQARARHAAATCAPYALPLRRPREWAPHTF